jgi:hypothetical protein
MKKQADPIGEIGRYRCPKNHIFKKPNPRGKERPENDKLPGLQGAGRAYQYHQHGHELVAGGNMTDVKQLRCDHCGVVGPGVKAIFSKHYPIFLLGNWCEDTSACEARKEAALDKAYQEQLKHPGKKAL